MTDPKELAELADGLRWMFEHEQMNYDLLRPAAAHLDAYARILAADTDTREIEERNVAAIAEVEALDPLAGIVVTRAQKDCATLLDANRKLRAELEAANTRAKESGKEANQLRMDKHGLELELRTAKASYNESNQILYELNIRETARVTALEKELNAANARAERLGGHSLRRRSVILGGR